MPLRQLAALAVLTLVPLASRAQRAAAQPPSQPYISELAALRRAITIATDAQQEAMRRAEPGMFEYQLESVIEGTFRFEGADRVGFPSIVGSGPNSTVLHYDVNRRQTRAGDLAVMDIGAEYGYFTADVTRTIPISGAVVTDEPGIYIPAESLGVRIEDDVLVTATGHELLSSAAPRRADDIERLMQEGRRTRPAARRAARE